MHCNWFLSLLKRNKKQNISIELFIMRNPILILFAFFLLSTVPLFAANNELWSHINNEKALIKYNVKTSFTKNDKERALNISQAEDGHYAWVSIPAPADGWGLDNARYVEAEIKNTDTVAVEVLMWIVPDKGWDGVGERLIIDAGASLHFKCDLRATYKDGTPKLNPHRIKKVEMMFSRASVGASIQVKGLKASGTAPDWVMPENRIEVPNMETGTFAAGKRVRYHLPSDTDTETYSVLYLPKTWTPKGKYPVIVEFPGNIYYTHSVYSTGRPEQCSIGYGMSKNVEAIWVCVPFVDYNLKENIESGFGNPEHTADYTMKIVNEIIEKFGGDKDNVVITGFSRGAIACGYIGRRNDDIAALWKGFHACQHYDGDGWNGADMAGAKERAKRIGERPIFHTDNEKHEDLKAMLSEVGANVTYASSGLGAHATAMFLDDRASTLQLRKWFKELVDY